MFVVAPTDDRSGAGASIGRMINAGPPPVERHVWDELPDLPVHAIDAPPAMAVFATCLGAFGDLPDLIASGINPGANTGHLVLHSGTVGATLTGAGYDIPGDRGVDRLERGEASTTGTSRRAWPRRRSSGRRSPTATHASSTSTCPTCRSPRSRACVEAELAPAGEVWVASADVSEGDLKIEITGRADSAPGTDVAFVKDGYVSVTR